MNFGRLMTAMITPLTESGAIDWPRVAGCIEHLIATGTESVVIAGTTGESPTLTHQEKLELCRYAVQQADGRVNIIVGTGSNNTQDSVELTGEVASTGVDGVMLVVPYYNKPTQEGLYRHFKTVAQSTSLPVMLYNIPGRSSVNMSVDTMIRLTNEVENIVMIKESSGNLVDVMELVSRKRKDVVVYSGMDELVIPYMSAGADGVVSVASHLVGTSMREMIEAFIQGKVDQAGEIQRKLIPLVEALFMTSSPAPLKYAMSQLGLCEEHVRLPVVPLAKEEKEKMDFVLQHLQIERD